MTSDQPAVLGREALAEFRDLWIHQPSCTFAATIEQLMDWDEQLYQAIERGEVDRRASWEIEEDEAAQRVARLIAEKLAPLSLTTSSAPSDPDNDTDASAEPKPNSDAGARALEPAPRVDVELVRAADVGMTSREWRGAIRRGELRASKVGRAYMVTRAAYEAFLEARRVATTSGPQRRTRHGDPASAAVERALSAGRLRALPGRRNR